MELTLNQYVEPLEIKVNRSGEEIETLDLELNLSDTVVFKSQDLSRELVEKMNEISDGTNIAKVAGDIADLLVPCIDLIAGDGATEKIAKAFGCSEPKDCVSGLVDIWKALNAEVAKRAGKSRVEAVSRYLDANA